MQAVDKIKKANKMVQGNGRNDHPENYSESYANRVYSVDHSTSMSADELIESIRDRMQNILMGEKRKLDTVRSMSLNNRKPDNGHVLYITLNNKSV